VDPVPNAWVIAARISLRHAAYVFSGTWLTLDGSVVLDAIAIFLVLRELCPSDIRASMVPSIHASMRILTLDTPNASMVAIEYCTRKISFGHIENCHPLALTTAKSTLTALVITWGTLKPRSVGFALSASVEPEGPISAW
jgi:hypothetical protein